MFRYTANIERGVQKPQDQEGIASRHSTTLSVVANNADEARTKVRAFIRDTMGVEKVFIQWTHFEEIVSECGGQCGNCPCKRDTEDSDAPGGCCKN